MSLHIIYGCMMSNKSSRLIELAQNLKKKHKIFVITHIFDTRFCEEGTYCGIDLTNRYLKEETFIKTHNGKKYPACGYDNLKNISEIDAEYILIDEAQFFPDLLDFCIKQKENGKHVYVAGLSKDFARKSFGQIDLLIEKLDKKTDTCEQLFAKCECGKDAVNSFRKSQQKEKIVIGGSECYEPVCNDCYDKKIIS